VAGLALEYYLLLRSILKTRPHLRPCLTRCRHCCIFFLSARRNAGRKDLRCPFGCKDAHRKRCSTERSVAYYRDSPGKIKKAIQNARRRKRVPASEIALPPSTDLLPCPEPVLEHLQVAVSLIEGRQVTGPEILAMLARVLRQHRMARRRRIDQAVDWLHANPP
jgi:hypothetical protein